MLIGSTLSNTFATGSMLMLIHSIMKLVRFGIKKTIIQKLLLIIFMVEGLNTAQIPKCLNDFNYGFRFARIDWGFFYFSSYFHSIFRSLYPISVYLSLKIFTRLSLLQNKIRTLFSPRNYLLSKSFSWTHTWMCFTSFFPSKSLNSIACEWNSLHISDMDRQFSLYIVIFGNVFHFVFISFRTFRFSYSTTRASSLV